MLSDREGALGQARHDRDNKQRKERCGQMVHLERLGLGIVVSVVTFVAAATVCGVLILVILGGAAIFGASANLSDVPFLNRVTLTLFGTAMCYLVGDSARRFFKSD